ncbi:penicillin-binding protein 1A [Geobacter grbiciae]|uniref:penicillin-binding protein 1A n=1 Tax=Geobacter grbiciae TaxID=155042 RepID=UPI001C01B052|nr:PBP1A family penicillin-binding protein [Geobacter grbiciae]MBT1076385.1 PBP1A family penicillin-binding protein [Geobacter grbiciae]
MTPASGRQNIDPRNVNRRRDKNPWKVVVITLVTLGVVALLAVFGYFTYLYASLPKVDRLADYRPPIVSQVFGDDGSLVGEFYLERRIVVPVEKIPRKLIQAFVAAEDSNFYQHKGLDYLGIARAAVKNLLAMRKKEGASTITQQVAKSMLLTSEKSFARKFKEAILATRMEKMLSKDDILYIYLNQIYLGGGAYGVQVAAETYFGKNVEQLNLAEMAMLAGLPKAPNSYSPIKHLDRARERQAYVLERMVREGYVTQAEADHARATPIVVRSMKKVNSEQSAYFLEHIRIKLEETYGMDRLYKEGLKIYTTMNAEMQKGAFDAVVNGLKNVDKRQGFRGAVKYLGETEVDNFSKKVEDGIDTASLKQGSTYQGVVTAVDPAKGDATVRVGDRIGTISRKNMAWAGKVQLVNAWGKQDGKGKSLPLGSVVFVSVLTPDVNKQGAIFSLDQEPEAQAAVVALDPLTGAVKAMVGGYDFRRSQFNRAVQAKRNPGSAFKPIIYAAALDKGLTAATTFDDSPVEYEGGGDKAWKPKNYDNIYRGIVTMREALTNSINVVSVKILEQIGVGAAIDYAKKLGITSPLAANLTLALGSSSVTPLELTSAYAVFASGGYRTTPYFITKVEDADGKVLEETAPPVIPTFTNQSTATLTNADLPPATGAVPGGGAVPAIAPETAYIITNLMESVVTSGTGQRARALGRPVAGKTGTTNDMKDAWFVGYVPQLVAGVWVGYDQERSLGAGGSGGQAAAPIWTEFMQRALAGIPVKNFIQPADITFATINVRTGRLAREGSPGATQECFVAGTEPTAYDGEQDTPTTEENASDSDGLPEWVRAGRLPRRSESR